MNKYTHRGWFGFCPIYLRDTYTNNPSITPRRAWLMPVLKASIFLQELAIGACSIANPHWEPVWKIRLTGKLP
jgi:hypothetical protein